MGRRGSWVGCECSLAAGVFPSAGREKRKSKMENVYLELESEKESCRYKIKNMGEEGDKRDGKKVNDVEGGP